MQTEIKNPFREKIEQAERGEISVDMFFYPINQGCAAAFDYGVVEALEFSKPRKFAEHLPEEREQILLISKEKVAIAIFIKVAYNSIKGFSHFDTIYEYWMPFPNLDEN